MAYQDTPACQMLATHCVSCGRALLDSVSVEVGMGPECRDGIFPVDVDDCDREVANAYVYNAAIAAQEGRAEDVVKLASLIRDLGFDTLADRVAKRFTGKVEQSKRNFKIVIDTADGGFMVKTPFRRGAKNAFIQAWREIPGRRYNRDKNANFVPADSKAALWGLLTEFFPGEWATGPKGVFRIAKA
jgi:hypothetical protein